jgi:hypothetical protein
MKTIVLFIALGMSLTGCATSAYYTNPNYQQTSSNGAPSWSQTIISEHTRGTPEYYQRQQTQALEDIAQQQKQQAWNQQWKK